MAHQASNGVIAGGPAEQGEGGQTAVLAGLGIAALAVGALTQGAGPSAAALAWGGLGVGAAVVFIAVQVRSGRIVPALLTMYGVRELLWSVLKQVPAVYRNSHVAGRLWRLHSCMTFPLALPLILKVCAHLSGPPGRSRPRLVRIDRAMVAVFGGLSLLSFGLGVALGNPIVDAIGDLYKHLLLLATYLAVALLVPRGQLLRLLGGMALIDGIAVATRVPSYARTIRSGLIQLREEAPQALPWLWACAGFRSSGKPLAKAGWAAVMGTLVVVTLASLSRTSLLMLPLGALPIAVFGRSRRLDAQAMAGLGALAALVLAIRISPDAGESWRWACHRMAKGFGVGAEWSPVSRWADRLPRSTQQRAGELIIARGALLRGEGLWHIPVGFGHGSSYAVSPLADSFWPRQSRGFRAHHWHNVLAQTAHRQGLLGVVGLTVVGAALYGGVLRICLLQRRSAGPTRAAAVVVLGYLTCLALWLMTMAGFASSALQPMLMAGCAGALIREHAPSPGTTSPPAAQERATERVGD